MELNPFKAIEKVVNFGVNLFNDGLNAVGKAIGIPQLNELLTKFGGLAKVVTQLSTLASNPMAAFALMQDIFKTLNAGQDASNRQPVDRSITDLGKILNTVKSFPGF
jgi:hypothetical protein